MILFDRERFLKKAWQAINKHLYHKYTYKKKKQIKFTFEAETELLFEQIYPY